MKYFLFLVLMFTVTSVSAIAQKSAEINNSSSTNDEAAKKSGNRYYFEALSQSRSTVSQGTLLTDLSFGTNNSCGAKKQDDCKGHKLNCWWEKFIEDPPTIFSSITAAFTLGLFAATVALWWVTRKLVIGANNTAHRQLRAYVIPNATIHNEHRPNGCIEIFVSVSIRNFGQTPASGCSYWLDICSHSRQAASIFGRPESARDSGIGVIAPGDTFTVKVELPLLSNGGEINEGRYAMYVYGQFHYTDAFGVNQTTNFRFMRSGNDWSNDGEMEVCAEGNDAT